jgi:hypothetical protein
MLWAAFFAEPVVENGFGSTGGGTFLPTKAGSEADEGACADADSEMQSAAETATVATRGKTPHRTM